jgi:hypothetical protein
MKERIQDLIEIQGGYTSYVDLHLELFEDSQNIARMSRYRPITSHRQAFEKLAQSLKVRDERCYLLRGPYGTGKSHLCLMFANYLRTPSGEKPMPEFFNHYFEADPVAAEDLKSKRSKGRYLVALCQWGGKGDFEEIVLRAVDEALRREGFGEDFDTHYLQAIKKIVDWESLEKEGDGRGRFMEEFRTKLANLSSSQTIAAFKKRLKEFDYPALDDFRQIHKDITTADFTYDKSDLIDILTHTLASVKFKERYQGLLVLFDEFGDTMERGNLSPKMFQKFAQLAAETPPKCAKLIFVGTAHKSLTQYAKSYTADDFQTASDRIKEIELTPNGVEDIIGAIVKIDKEHTLWKKKVAPKSHVFDKFIKECINLKLFDWLKAPRIYSNIIENIYPMHPMATYALLSLARDVASNNRSVFTFFAGDMGGVHADGSYGDFIANQPIYIKSKLNLYTADHLFNYFASALSADNNELRETLRELVRNYESSIRELNQLAGEDLGAKILQDDLMVMRLLRLMLIYDIIQISTKVENLYFGLYCTTNTEKGEVRNRLDALVSHGILYFDKNAAAYEFRKSKSINLDQMIEDYKKQPENLPDNIVAELETWVPLSKTDTWLEAKDYNLPYGEDKRLRRRLVRPAELTTDTFFENLEINLDNNSRGSDYEGFAIYVVCNSSDEITKAKNLCARNKSDRTVVAIPRAPVVLLDAIMDVKALKYIESSKEADDFSTQDKSTLSSRLRGDSKRKGALDVLKELRDKLLNHREVTWYGKTANTVAVEANKPYDAANRVMEKLYSENRNKFVHDDFNKLRFRINKNKNTALKEAVEELLDFTEPIVVDTDFAQQRGDIRYLQKCLLNNNVMNVTRTDGTKQRCEIWREPQKFSNKLPALAGMIQDIEALQPKQKLLLSEWLAKYRQPSYGQGSVSLALSLAVIRRYFGDSIQIKEDETSIIGMPFKNFETVVKVVQDGRYPQAFISYRPLTTEERKFVEKVYEIFGIPDSAVAATESITLQKAFNALQDWWTNLPPLARVPSLYSEETHPHATDFLGAMEVMAAKDPHSFLLDIIPAAFGDGEGLAITSETIEKVGGNLPKVKGYLEQCVERVEARIVDAIREIFDVQQHTYSGIIDAISKWFDDLDSNQRDPVAQWHTNESKPLVIYLKTLTDIKETFFERIPANPDYGLKRVSDWITDHTDEYVDRLQSGKEHIEASRLKVEAPSVKTVGKVKRDGNQILFQDKVTVTLCPKNPGERIFITENHDNPTNPDSKRQEHKGEFTFETKERKTIRYAIRDADGNWGLPETLELINETKKFEVSVQHAYKNEDSAATFTFPQDTESLSVSLNSFVQIALQLKVTDAKELKKILKSLLEEL